MISVIILTKNEEEDLKSCLHSVNWCDDIHVVDSGSADQTVTIARSMAANVWQNPFESFGKQRNFALEKISTKYNWILFLDADENSTNAFHKAVVDAISTATGNVAGFYCCWKMMLDGKWLKNSDNFPKWQFRLVKKGMAKFTDFGHGQKESEVIGEIQYIKEPYTHYGFSKGWSNWIQRHNKYSSEEALVRTKDRPPFKNVFSKHGSVRNPALRSWLSKLPGWPVLRFLQAYILNLGLLEGLQGFNYCINMAFYEFLIKIKIQEIKKKQTKAYLIK